MKTIFKLSIIAMMFTTNLLFAQNDTIGWGRNSRFNRMYDVKTVTEISGEIVKIESVAPMAGMSTGIHITVNADGQDYSVHVGPKWYLDSQSPKLSEKDKVRVKGSKVMFEGTPAIIALEVSSGNQVLKLRDKNGIPVWAGRKRP